MQEHVCLPHSLLQQHAMIVPVIVQRLQPIPLKTSSSTAPSTSPPWTPTCEGAGNRPSLQSRGVAHTHTHKQPSYGDLSEHRPEECIQRTLLGAGKRGGKPRHCKVRTQLKPSHLRRHTCARMTAETLPETQWRPKGPVAQTCRHTHIYTRAHTTHTHTQDYGPAAGRQSHFTLWPKRRGA